MKIFLLFLFLLFNLSVFAVENNDLSFDDIDDNLIFNDSPLKDELSHPDWFKHSFLNLPEDIIEAKKDKKKGIIVYFGQRFCPYCKTLMEVNWRKPDIVKYTRDNFDVIALSIWGNKEVVLPDGTKTTEREYAIRNNANFTPSLIFYDVSGKQTLMLRGYYPPYKFLAALEYVVGEHYKQESLASFMLRANPPPKFEIGDLNEQDFFTKAPFMLDRSRFKAQKPLAVFFEQKDCYACDVLHSKPLSDKNTKKLLDKFEIIQVDTNDRTPIVIPGGQKINVQQWAQNLQIFYTPTIVFFDEMGVEIIRVESVAHLYRIQNVLKFVIDKTYLVYPNFATWRFDMLF
ncbi:MAG: thioredoxin [Gammaproteobacteria bacterium]|nr:MAG: thioredoxin [Gammaproteobacteria bacterium]